MKILLSFAVVALTVSVGLSVCAESVSVTTNEQGEVTVALNGTGSSNMTLDYVFHDPDVKSVAYVGENASATLSAAEPSTYIGGTSIGISQLRFLSSHVFGTGPISLVRPEGSLVNYNAGAIDLTNQLDFAAKVWVMAVGNNDLKVHALGSTDSPALAYFGRSGGNDCQISFALDSPENEALDGIRLRGNQKLNIDGGTFKAASSAKSDYFVIDDPSVDSISPRVSAKGFAFDVAEGGDVRFGIPLTIDSPPTVTTNLTVWGEPSNNSFETGSTGWTLNKGEIGSAPVVVHNTTNTNWIFADEGTTSYALFRTRFGENQLAVRGGNNVVSPPFKVTESGEAYVTFWMTSRPSKSTSDYNSDHLAVEVTLTSVGSGSAQTVILPGRPQNLSKTNGYLHYNVGPFAVEQKEYTITLKVEKGNATSKALFFDLVQLCKLDFTTNLTTVSKTGAGSLTFDDLRFDSGLLAVREGELKFGDSLLTNMSAEVEAGSTFTVGSAAKFGDAAVKVAEGATLRFVGPLETNLIKNPSFEDDAITSSNGYDYLKPTGWTPAVVEANDQNKYQPYYCQKNGGTLSRTSPWTTAGTQTVALREKVCLKQSFTAARAGTYRIAFTYACRDWSSTNLRLHASIGHDGSKIALTDEGGLVPSSAAFSAFTAQVELSAGVYELRFDADGDDTEEQGRGMVVLIDDVVASEVRSSDADFAGARFELTAGSVLQLDNPGRVKVDEFYVDGVRLSGGKHRISETGVTVVGDGAIHVGDEVGAVILIR